MNTFRIALILKVFILINTAHGQILFQKSYPGAGGYSYGIQQRNDDGYIVAIGSALIKINAYGDTLWTKQYSGMIVPYQGSFLPETTDGGFVLVGQTPVAGNQDDVCLIRTDSLGNLLWAKTYGGVRNDWGKSVAGTSDNGCIVSARTSSFDDDTTVSYSYLLKLDTSGNIEWTNVFGYDSEPSCARQLNDGSYAVAGRWGNKCYLAKFDSSGTFQWTNIFGGSNGQEEAFYFTQTEDSGFVVIGDTYGSFRPDIVDVYVAKFDTLGKMVWSKTYGNSNDDWGWCVNQTSDKGYIIESSSMLIKTDVNGDTIWARSHDWHVASSVIQTKDEGYAINDVIITKTDSMGFSCNPVNPDSIIITSPPSISTFTININTMIYYTGFTGTPTITETSGGSVTNLCFTTMTNNLSENKNMVTIYPNPTNSDFTININGQERNHLLSIYDALGKEIIRNNFSGNKITIKENLPKGIYFITIAETEIVFRQKLIVE